MSDPIILPPPPTERHCAVCGDEAWVGVGTPVQWVCLDHFDAWLREIAARAEKATGRVRRLIGRGKKPPHIEHVPKIPPQTS